MGRKTWESLRAPLSGRQNIVLTRDQAYNAPGAAIARTLEEALAIVSLPAPVFCIGGGEIYRAALPHADTLYLTEIDREYEGDVTFPQFDRAQWQAVSRESGRTEGADALDFHFVTYRRCATTA
jgi:dihydrofolate reductase